MSLFVCKGLEAGVPHEHYAGTWVERNVGHDAKVTGPVEVRGRKTAVRIDTFDNSNVTVITCTLYTRGEHDNAV
jgi:hypothetical protein